MLLNGLKLFIFYKNLFVLTFKKVLINNLPPPPNLLINYIFFQIYWFQSFSEKTSWNQKEKKKFYFQNSDAINFWSKLRVKHLKVMFLKKKKKFCLQRSRKLNKNLSLSRTCFFFFYLLLVAGMLLVFWRQTFFHFSFSAWNFPLLILPPFPRRLLIVFKLRLLFFV